MPISGTVPAVQSWVVKTVNLEYADGTTAKDLVEGSTNGRKVTTVSCYSDSLSPVATGGSSKVVLEAYDGTTASTLAVADLQATAYTQQLFLSFSDVVLPSSTYKLRARVTATVPSAAKLMFVVRAGDY